MIIKNFWNGEFRYKTYLYHTYLLHLATFIIFIQKQKQNLNAYLQDSIYVWHVIKHYKEGNPSKIAPDELASDKNESGVETDNPEKRKRQSQTKSHTCVLVKQCIQAGFGSNYAKTNLIVILYIKTWTEQHWWWHLPKSRDFIWLPKLLALLAFNFDLAPGLCYLPSTRNKAERGRERLFIECV